MKEKYESIQHEIYKMQLEYDVLKAASEIIKKEQGITMKLLINYEKVIVIDTFRDKYDYLRENIRKIFAESMGTYGYRRIYMV